MQHRNDRCHYGAKAQSNSRLSIVQKPLNIGNIWNNTLAPAPTYTHTDDSGFGTPSRWRKN